MQIKSCDFIFCVSSSVLECIVADLSKAQRSLSKTLCEFRFECIGSEQTDDEIVIGVCCFTFADHYKNREV